MVKLKGLTTGSNKDNFPAWSPTGDRIAFTSDRDGDYEIYSIRSDGADLKRLQRPGNDAHALGRRTVSGCLHQRSWRI